MLALLSSTTAYFKRLLLTLLILPCLVVAEQAPKGAKNSAHSDVGMSLAEHYTLNADTLRLRLSRESDLHSGNTPDHYILPLFETPLAHAVPTREFNSFMQEQGALGCPISVSARAPPAAFIIAA